jgi:hypothetical protein
MVLRAEIMKFFHSILILKRYSYILLLLDTVNNLTEHDKTG